MSTEVLTQSVLAGTPAIFGNGSIFVIVSAVAPVSIVARTLGSSNKNRVFANVPAGFKFTADSPNDGFDRLEVSTGVNQNVTLAIGDDDVEFSNAVTVNGSVVTQETPATTLTDAAPVACPTGALTAVVPVNTSRRRVGLMVDPAFAGAGFVFARAAGGAQNLIPMSPGVLYSFAGTYGVSVRNDTGTSATVYVVEES